MVDTASQARVRPGWHSRPDKEQTPGRTALNVVPAPFSPLLSPDRHRAGQTDRDASSCSHDACSCLVSQKLGHNLGSARGHRSRRRGLD